MSEQAPIFSLAWDMAQAYPRSRDDVLAVSANASPYESYEDSGYFRGDEYQYFLETGADLHRTHTLLGFAASPDHYLRNDLSDGTFARDPVMSQDAGCSISLRYTWGDRERNAVIAALSVLDIPEAQSAQDFGPLADQVLSTHSAGYPMYLDLPAGAIPDLPSQLLYQCTSEVTFFSDSEEIATRLSAQITDEILNIGAFLQENTSAETWVTLYDPLGDGEASTTPVDRLYQMNFHRLQGPSPARSGLRFGRGELVSVKFEPQIEPRFSDVYNHWTVGSYITVEFTEPLSARQVSQIENGTFFDLSR